MDVLGINAYHGDMSAAPVHDGNLMPAMEEERTLRICECRLRIVE
jgi:predicted NodU family carbamoyl transferase